MALRIVVVGLGARGREWGKAVRDADGFELVAAVDRDRGALNAAGTELGLAPDRLHAEAEALEPRSVDAVIVATPPEHHAEACRVALERGIGVLVEKPFTPDLAAARELAALAEARGLPLLVAQNYRYLRVHRAVRRIVHGGRLGAIRLVTAHHYRGERPADAPPGADSLLWHLAVHHLDALRDVLAQEVAAVAAQSHGGDGVQTLLEFSGGTRAVYTITRRSTGHEYFEGGKEFYERIVGSRGTLHVLHRWLVLCEAGRLPRIVRRGSRPTTEEVALLGELDRALRGERPAGISARDNLGTVAAVDACARSLRERRWVPVGEREEVHA
jgi:predicted dehydrogenase